MLKKSDWNIPRHAHGTVFVTIIFLRVPVFEIVPEAFALGRRGRNEGSYFYVREELVVDGGSFVTQRWTAVACFLPFDSVSVHYSPSHRRYDLPSIWLLGLYCPVVEEVPESWHFSDYRPGPNGVKRGGFAPYFVGSLPDFVRLATSAVRRRSLFEPCPSSPRLRGSRF